MNWNELSDDSWNQVSSSSDDQQKKKEPETSQQKPSQQQKPAETKQQKKPTHNEDDPNKQKKPYIKKESKKYPTDEQMLKQYEQGKIQQNRRLKVNRCFQKQQQQMLANLLKDKKISKLRNYKENFYVVNFYNKEDLIKFIKEKIDKKYKFKISQYIQSEKQKEWKAQKQKQRDQKRAKQQQEREKKHKQHREGDRDHKDKKYRQRDDKQKPKQASHNPSYRDENETKREKKQYQKKQSQKHEYKNDHKNEHKYEHKNQNREKDKNKNEKKHKNQIKSLLRQNQRKAEIIVLNDDDNVTDAAQWIQKQKIPKQFSQFILLAKGNLFSYMDRLSQQIHKTLNFGLSSEINEQECQKKPQEQFKYIYIQKHVPKQIKKNIAAVYISKPSQQNFDTVQKYNTHIIGYKGNHNECVQFDEKQYLQLFKKNYKDIKWENWIIYAFQKNIAKLLRLSGAFKKLLNKNKVKYEVGIRDQGTYAKFQICDLNKTKYKIDTSAINSHLQNL